MPMPSPEFDAIISADFFCLGIRSSAQELHEIRFLPIQDLIEPRNPLAKTAAEQLVAWVKDPRFKFDLPLNAAGTAFRRRVWQAISAIPYGETRSYGDLAKTLNSAPRAVGGACGDNPYPIVVPCHRVVAKTQGFNGGLGGFAHSSDGLLINIKKWLLEHENRHA
ncbi:MAG TPA: methylated-DNA--[protein]-cysteine S-methyltransferase [Rhodocyclaceae bacterium]|nr:methylated-DNA--[protein]-cysteine S-methyltransferase [Rhodocyclaceae bacterium]